MRPLLIPALAALVACDGGGDDTGADTSDTGADTSDTGADTTDSTDTSDTGADTSDSAAPTAADLLDAGKTVQEVLDAGFTPLEIYQADAALLDTIYGSTYQGGLIFHLDTSAGTGLVADPGASRDSHPWTGVMWSCAGDVAGADGLAVGNGMQNTLDIVAACPNDTTAASVCADLELGGYSDWFLPSRDELQLMYTNLKDNGNQGSLYANHYWSSSEWSTSAAYYVHFATGSAAQDAKTAPDRVRAVRAF